MRAIPIGLNAWKTDSFYYYAVADKVLHEGRVKYLLFFDVDQVLEYMPFLSAQIFPTPNGFHAIGDSLESAEMKSLWFEVWRRYYPDSDYQLNNISWLAPHSHEELDFILKVVGDAEMFSCKYYRDKAVFSSGPLQ